MSYTLTQADILVWIQWKDKLHDSITCFILQDSTIEKKKHNSQIGFDQS